MQGAHNAVAQGLGILLFHENGIVAVPKDFAYGGKLRGDNGPARGHVFEHFHGGHEVSRAGLVRVRHSQRIGRKKVLRDLGVGDEPGEMGIGQS